MITISNLTTDDFEAAGIVLDTAYQNTGAGERLPTNYSIQPDGWFCARSNGELVGVVAAVIYDNFASIGSMAVHPKAQRQGIALALMEHLLCWLDATGCQISFLDASEMGAPL